MPRIIIRNRIVRKKDNPQWACGYCEDNEMDIRQIIAANLRALKTHYDLTNIQMARRCAVGEGTVNRAMSGTVGVASDVLQQLAQGFGLEAWQIMVQNLDPSNPPLICHNSPEEQALYNRLKAVLKTSTQ